MFTGDVELESEKKADNFMLIFHAFFFPGSFPKLFKLDAFERMNALKKLQHSRTTK